MPVSNVRFWNRTRHELRSRAGRKFSRPRDVVDPIENLAGRFDAAADSEDEDEWSGEEGGGLRRSSAPMGADSRSRLLLGKRQRNTRVAAFAGEEAEVYRIYAALRATGHKTNKRWFGSEMRMAIKRNWGDAAGSSFLVSKG